MLRHTHLPQFQIGQMRRLGADAGHRGIGQLHAVADLHGVGAVNHQQCDVPQTLPRFPHQRGAGQPRQQHRESGRAQPGAAGPAP